MKRQAGKVPTFRSSPGAEWDPEVFIQDRVSELMLKHFGVEVSSRHTKRILRDIVARDSSMELTHDGLRRETEIVVPFQALAYWVAKKLCSTPDGVIQVVKGPPVATLNVKSALYNATLETLRTSKGSFLCAEEVATRLHLDLHLKRSRKLRQLRRMLRRVVKDNGGSIRRDGKARTLFGFR